MSGESEQPEGKLKTAVLTSRDRAVLREQFTHFFREPHETAGFDNDTKLLWAMLRKVATMMRRRGGVTMEQLEQETGLLPSKIRMCIRILIDLGGEVEVVTDGFPHSALFFLHN